MPAAKRAAPKAAEKATKAAKKESKVVEERDTFQEECETILSLLNEDESMNESAKHMLLSAAPFALKPPKVERHKLQDGTVSMLADILNGIKSSKGDALKNSEVALNEVASSQAAAEKALEAAKETAAEKSAARDGAQKEMDGSDKEVIAANAAKASAVKALEGLKASQEKTVAEKTERESLITTSWEKLKEGGFTGKEWNQKNKLIKTVVSVLDATECEGSAKLALQVALKAKPAERGPVALKSIEHCEEQLKLSLKVLVDKVNAHGTETEAHEAAIKTADDGLEAAKKTAEEKQAAFITAENVLLQSNEEVDKADEALKALIKKSATIKSDLSSAQEKLAEVASLLERFAALVEDGEAATKKKQEEPAPAASPAKETTEDVAMPAAA